MKGRPRRTVEAVTVKLGRDTIAMLRRSVRASSLDAAVKELARRAGIRPETFGTPEMDGSTGGAR